MSILYLDTETYSETPIKDGTYRYAETAEVMVVAFAWDDDAPTVWDLTDERNPALLQNWRADLQAQVDRAETVVVHNSMFDRTVLRENGVVVPPEKIEDTMVTALSHSLPGSLDMLCEVLAVPTDLAKLKTGKRLIQLFCKPQPDNRKIRRATRETHPAEWAEFLAYAAADIPSMREIRRRMPRWNYPRAAEHELWVLDQAINDRGFQVDVELARAATRAAEDAKKRLRKEIQSATGGDLESTTQRNKTLEYLKEAYGFSMTDLTGANIEKTLERSDIAPEIREVLLNRQQSSLTSPAKYGALIRGVSSDNRLRGTIQFCGASRTGRDAGRLFQPQNLPRPSLKPHVIDTGIEAMKAGAEDLLFDNVMELCSCAVRGCIVAAPGKKLVIADLSNIEGRMLAWLAGEEWKLEAFRAYDRGEGADLYKLAYANAFGVPVSEVTSDRRQIGKVMELMLGYEGGVGAFLTGAETYGFDIEAMAQNAVDTLPEDAKQKAAEMLAWRKGKGLTTYGLSDTAFIVCESFKALWRAAHPKTVSLWKDSASGAKSATEAPGSVYRANKLAFQRDGDWLRLRLPSGRYICYAMPALDPEDGSLTFAGTNQYTRRWGRLHTYSGKLVENATQAASRDILFGWVKRAEQEGYRVVLRVHDELICEVPDTEEFSVERLAALGSEGESWSEGLPLAAAGYETYRYRKAD
jgi:DNA polymerase